MTNCDVAIVGTGPYGLSVAAHLRAIKGLEVRVFGESMSFWERHMPIGMWLRSPWAGSHLSDPAGSLTLDAYRKACGDPRLENVPVMAGRFVVSAEPTGERLKLKLDDGSEKTVDHALLGTGYRADIRKHAFLSSRLRASICNVDGYPQLRGSFESSVPGLHFVGAPAAWSFGPLICFVAGADFTSRGLSRGIAGECRSPSRLQSATVYSSQDL